MGTIRGIAAGRTAPGIAKRGAWACALGVCLAAHAIAVDRYERGFARDSTGHAITCRGTVVRNRTSLTGAATCLGAKRVDAHTITCVVFGVALTELFWIAEPILPALNVGFTIDALPSVFVANEPWNATVFDAVFDELVGYVDVRFALIRLRHIVVQNGDWETVIGIVIGTSKQAKGQECKYDLHLEIQW